MILGFWTPIGECTWVLKMPFIYKMWNATHSFYDVFFKTLLGTQLIINEILHARVVHYMGNWCCMVDKYRVFIILLIWLKSNRHKFGVECPSYIPVTLCSMHWQAMCNANFIINDTTFLKYKTFFVSIAIILYALSINQKFPKLEHPTSFWNKNNV